MEAIIEEAVFRSACVTGLNISRCTPLMEGASGSEGTVGSEGAVGFVFAGVADSSCVVGAFEADSEEEPGFEVDSDFDEGSVFEADPGSDSNEGSVFEADSASDSDESFGFEADPGSDSDEDFDSEEDICALLSEVF